MIKKCDDEVIVGFTTGENIKIFVSNAITNNFWIGDHIDFTPRLDKVYGIVVDGKRQEFNVFDVTNTTTACVNCLKMFKPSTCFVDTMSLYDEKNVIDILFDVDADKNIIAF